MSDTKDGGPAFPKDRTDYGYAGMSLRDWFAGQALTAFISNLHPKAIANAIEIASSAYLVADCMLAARDAKEGK